MTTTIDVHWHHVPKKFADAVVSGEVPIAGQVVTKDDGSALIKMDNGFKQPLPAFLMDPATIIADLDAAGVDVACASIAPPLSHLDCDPQIALGVSRAINDCVRRSWRSSTTDGSSRSPTCRCRTWTSRSRSSSAS